MMNQRCLLMPVAPAGIRVLVCARPEKAIAK
jgi:hypothetical protein